MTTDESVAIVTLIDVLPRLEARARALAIICVNNVEITCATWAAVCRRAQCFR